MQGTDARKNKKFWRESLAVYLQMPILWVFLLGIASGFPRLLVGSTLTARLTDSGINTRAIGVFALVSLPYVYKFLVAPCVDAVHFPFVKTHLNHRKVWGMLSQFLLALSLLGMGLCDPAANIVLLGIVALLTASFSALQDIIIDAIRIEIAKKEDQGPAAASLVTGYRVGMLLSGAGVLFLTSLLSWQEIYIISATIITLFMLVTMWIRRLAGYEEAVANNEMASKSQTDMRAAEPFSWRVWAKKAFIEPFTEFIGRKGAIIILLFIATFKLGEALAGYYAMPFYKSALHFTWQEIAAISKVFGFVATIIGAFIGGIVVKRMSLAKALLLCGSLQLASNFCYIWLSYAGHDNLILTLSITIENVTGGMNTTAFITFLSRQVNVKYTATQYALLSSLSALGQSVLAAPCGALIEHIGWNNFFIFTVFCGLPALGLLYFVSRGMPKSVEPVEPNGADDEEAS